MSKSETYNKILTEHLNKEIKYKTYVKWAQTHGVIMNKIRYPVAFGQDESNFVVGSAAKLNIKNNDVIVYVPQKVLITVERALASPIGFIFDNHASIFKATEDRDYLVLLVFLIYEHQKGTRSFWHPYFEAIDPGLLPCFWSDQTIEELADSELKDQIRQERDNYEEDWDMLFKILRLYAPEHFNLRLCNQKLYQRCVTFVSTRCFGWGLPTTFIAPIADSFNHSALSSNRIDIVNRKFHKDKSNDLYVVDYDFKNQQFREAERLNYDAKELFTINRTLKKDMTVQPINYDNQEEQKSYEITQSQQLKNSVSCEKYKELFESKDQNFMASQNIWDLYFELPDIDQDKEELTEEKDSKISLSNENLRRKMLSDQGESNLSMFEIDTIKNNTRLREVYQYRWWRDEDQQNYLVIVNTSGKDISAGEQVYYNYGKRTNADLLANYGFCLDESNIYNSLEFKVMKDPIKIKDRLQYLPDQKTKESEDYLDLTNNFVVKSHRLNENMFEYLRKHLFYALDKDQQKSYNVSVFTQPKSLDFELMVIREAIQLLESHAQQDNLTQLDVKAYQQLYDEETSNFRMKFIRLYNLERRKIFDNHIKQLKVLYLIVQSYKNVKGAAWKYIWDRVLSIEYQDSVEEIFYRRMGMRDYLVQAAKLIS
eukprot:403342378